eukprot:scaffold19568_cov35-Phaeocystis_antarctica.AAC.1
MALAASDVRMGAPMPSVAMANGAARSGAGCSARSVKPSPPMAIRKRHALRRHARRWTPRPPFLTKPFARTWS